MPIVYPGVLQLTKGGIPWVVDPGPHAFALPAGERAFAGIVVATGTPFVRGAAEHLGTGDTRQIAAVVDGSDDVIVVGARARYDIEGKTRTDRELHEICASGDAEMKRNGDRLLELIEEALRYASETGNTIKVQSILRSFSSVAFRHERVANALDRHNVSAAQIRRWFGLKAGRGRPGRSIPETSVLVGTLDHECSAGGTIREAIGRVAATGFVEASLANLRSNEGELYRLSTAGVWVSASRLMRLPWVAPELRPLRWDVYRVELQRPQEGTCK